MWIAVKCKDVKERNLLRKMFTIRTTHEDVRSLLLRIEISQGQIYLGRSYDLRFNRVNEWINDKRKNVILHTYDKKTNTLIPMSLSS